MLILDENLGNPSVLKAPGLSEPKGSNSGPKGKDTKKGREKKVLDYQLGHCRSLLEIVKKTRTRLENSPLLLVRNYFQEVGNTEIHWAWCSRGMPPQLNTGGTPYVLAMSIDVYSNGCRSTLRF